MKLRPSAVVLKLQKYDEKNNNQYLWLFACQLFCPWNADREKGLNHTLTIQNFSQYPKQVTKPHVLICGS
jgi:hypothetical protein